MRLVFSLSVLISSFSWVILTVLKVDMAMAAIKMPMAINIFGRPGVEISIFWGSAFMMSRKSSSDASMARLTSVTSVTDFVIDLKGSLFFFQQLIVNSGDGLLGVEYGGEVEKDAFVDVR